MPDTVDPDDTAVPTTLPPDEDASDESFRRPVTEPNERSEGQTTDLTLSVADLGGILNRGTEEGFEGYSSTTSETAHSGSADNDYEYGGREIQIRGEPFYLRREDDRVIISHKRWSLIGYGDTLTEAEKELFECARRLSVSYLDHPVDEMSPEAVRMRNFIAELVSYAELA